MCQTFSTFLAPRSVAVAAKLPHTRAIDRRRTFVVAQQTAVKCMLSCFYLIRG